MNKSVLKQVVKYLLAAVVLYFVLRRIIPNWEQVTSYGWDINYWWLLAASVITMAALLVNAQVWRFLIAGFGHQVGLGAAFRIIYLANLGRYVPGKVWAVAGMTYLARQAHIPTATALTSSVMVMVFTLPSAFLISFIVPLVYPELITDDLAPYAGPLLYICAIGTFLVSLLVVTFPNAAFKLLNLLLVKLKRAPVDFVLRRSLAVKVYVGYTISWSLYGLAFPCFLRAIIPDPGIPILASAGAYVFAYQIGFISIFSPGGLGVRELALTSMLTVSLGGPIAAGVAVAARLWNLVVEVIVSLIALSLRRLP